MAFNVSGLGTWINENSQELISKAILESNTIKDVTLMPGVKYKEQIKFLAGDALIQAAACGTPTASGTTTLTDKDIEVVSLMVYEELCPEDFSKTSLQLSMKPGWNTEIPFEQQYSELKIKNLQKAIETMIWSKTAASTVKCVGWEYLAEADSDVNDRTYSWAATGKTSSDYFAEVYGMINDLPDEIQSFDDLVLLTPPEVARKMVQSFVIAGNYHINYVNQDTNGDWYFPGTNVIVKPKAGLAGSNSVFLTPASNLIVATDLQSEWENFKLWYSDDDLLVKFLQTLKIGVSYYFGDYIVLSNA